jgi:hypothetical protein
MRGKARRWLTVGFDAVKAMLYIRADVQRPDHCQVMDGARLAPVRELGSGMVVRSVRVPISNRDGEELSEPFRRPRMWREH